MEAIKHTGTQHKHDWGLVAAGALLIVCSFIFLVAPDITLVTITAIAGAAFLVSGVMDLVNYFRYRKVADLSAWAVVYAICDFVIGGMLLLHPLLYSAVIPWVVGVFFVAFGVMEIFGSVQMHKSGASAWGWMLFSGIVSILCGVMFFAAPASLSIFLSVFVLMRGTSLIFYGWNAGKMENLF